MAQLKAEKLTISEKEREKGKNVAITISDFYGFTEQ